MASVKIPIEKLTVGLFVDLYGTGEKGFLITGDEHLEQIRATGLAEVDVIPEKSEAPLPGRADPEDVKPKPHKKRKVDQKEWTEEEHKSFAQSVKQHSRTLSSVPDIMDKMATKAQGAENLADELVADLAGIITGVDFAVNLMPMTRDLGPLPLKHQQHSLNVSIVSMMLGRNLDMDEELIRTLGKGGLFHDIGKDLFRKATGQIIGPGHPMYAKHPLIGMDLAVKTMGLPAEVGEIILNHHERFDGSGFPKGLSGKDIPVSARIVSAVDAFDNLCNDWLGEPPLTPHEALKVLYRDRAKYGEGLLTKLVRFMGIYPPGSIVTLSNSATAMVIAVNPENPLLPTVQIYEPKTSRKKAPVIRLGNMKGNLKITENLPHDHIPQPVHDYFRPLPVLSYFAGAVLC